MLWNNNEKSTKLPEKICKVKNKRSIYWNFRLSYMAILAWKGLTDFRRGPYAPKILDYINNRLKKDPVYYY